MKRSYIAIVSATMLALSPLASTMTFAQMTDYEAIETQVTGDLAQIGVNDVDVSSLTLRQLQEIKLVAGGSQSSADKKRLVDAIVAKAPE